MIDIFKNENNIILQLNNDTNLYFNLNDNIHLDYLINFTFGVFNIISAYIKKESYCSTLTLPFGYAFYSNKIVFTSYKGNIFATIHQTHVVTGYNKIKIILEKDEILDIFNKILNIFNNDEIYDILKEKNIYFNILEMGDYLKCTINSYYQ